MKRYQKLRRGLSMLLSLVMCLTLLPVNVLAEDVESGAAIYDTSEAWEDSTSDDIDAGDNRTEFIETIISDNQTESEDITNSDDQMESEDITISDDQRESEDITISDKQIESEDITISDNQTESEESSDIITSDEQILLLSEDEVINTEGESVSSNDVDINEENFPDSNFRSYVSSYFDKDSDGKLSAGEIESVKTIDCDYKFITCLKGIEYFTALTSLKCGNNQLTSLDVSKNTALTCLECHGNQLTALNINNCKDLKTLECQYNQLTELNVSQNTALTKLNCYTNQLTVLNVSQNTELTYLDCSKNQLTELNVSQNTALTMLNCYTNQLTELNVSQNTELPILRCYDNQLTELNVSQNTELTTLYCYSNRLTALDVSNNTKLEWLNCSNNYLTSLNLLNNSKLFVSELDATNNSYEIRPVNGTFDLSTLPGNFDVSKSDNWDGASVNGNTLMLDSGALVVTYSYDCGNDKSATFTLLVNEADTEIAIDETNFPDQVFREYVAGSTIDRNQDGKLSAGEMALVKTISCEYKTITSLKGIEYFKELTTLKCASNRLTELNVSQNTALTTLNCYMNQLTELSVSQNTALTSLSCYDNQLTELNVSQNTALTSLSCYDNQLTELNVSQNTALTTLSCYENQLTELNVSQNTALTTLKCYRNQLTELDLSNNSELISLNCYSNQLAELDLSNNTKLKSLICYTNQLTSLDLANTGLTSLNAEENYFEITPEGGTFDLNTLPGKFNPDNASGWTGGSVTGTILTPDSDATVVTYSYDCGKGNSVTFTLLINNESRKIAISEAYFPDKAFREYISDYFDLNRDGKLSIGEISLVKEIDVYGTYDLRDLTGIAYFTELEDLDCSSCVNLQILDISKNTKLKTLECYFTALTYLDISQNTALTSLDASGNTYPIKLDENRTFDLSTLPKGFNVENVSKWVGGSVKGNTLTVNSGVGEVTYDYDCGRDQTVTFTLEIGYTVTAYGLYGTDLEFVPGEVYVETHTYLKKIDLGIGKRDGYTLQDLTLVGIEESELRWTHKDGEIEDREVSFLMPANDVTVIVNWKKNTDNHTINKKYLYTRENAASIDLANYLPEDCGAINYGTPQIEGNLYTEDGAPVILNDILSYTVKDGSVGDKGTIQVTVTTDKYIDFTITINVELTDRIPVSLKAGSVVSLEKSTLTYGETLSTLTFNSAVFEGDGAEVAGTLTWKTPDALPDTAVTRAEWIFIPSDEAYETEDGYVSITVQKAALKVTADPVVAEQIYHPDNKLANIDLTGGEVKGVSENILAGTWKWKKADVVPTVGKNEFEAVFTPNEPDKANYDTVTRTVSVNVIKATPYIKTVPTATITYGETLADAVFTGGIVQYSESDPYAVSGNFTWKNGEIKPSVSDSNITAYKIIFTPYDKANYNTAETAITVTVNKSENGPDLPSPSGSPEATPSSNPSGSPEATPSSNPSGSPEATPSSNPSGSPEATPSGNPSGSPEATPSSNPSTEPSTKPSAVPGAVPQADVQIAITQEDLETKDAEELHKIAEEAISEAVDKAIPNGIVYNGNKRSLDISLTMGDVQLAEGTDYTIKYKNSKNAGIAQLIIKSIGEYKKLGTVIKEFTIQPLDISEHAFGAADLYYEAGKTVKPSPVLYYNGKKLKAGKDFTYIQDKLSENSTLVLTGTGNYTGTRKIQVVFIDKKTETRTALSKAKVTVNKKLLFTGSLVEPTGDDFVVTIGSGKKKVTLQKGVDYTVSFSSNNKPGTAVAVISGISTSEYCYGTKAVTFKIAGTKISKAAVTLSLTNADGTQTVVGTKKGMEAISTGSAIIPDVTAKITDVNGKEAELKEGTDYTVSYKKNRKKGTASVVITGIGAYTGSKTVKFKIKE